MTAGLSSIEWGKVAEILERASSILTPRYHFQEEGSFLFGEVLAEERSVDSSLARGDLDVSGA